MAFWLPLIGTAAGLGKTLFEDKPREARERKLAAETQRYSPWTGLQGKMPQESSGMGSVLQGATTGLALGQSLDQAEQQSDWLKSLMGGSEGGGSPDYGVLGRQPASLGVNTGLGDSSQGLWAALQKARYGV